MPQVGDAIFAQIITDCKDVEPELVCVTSDNKKGGFGVLSNKGFVISVPLHICRRLLSPDSKVIPTLGKKYRFESTVGMNGRIWVNAKNVRRLQLRSLTSSSLSNTSREDSIKKCAKIFLGIVTKLLTASDVTLTNDHDQCDITDVYQDCLLIHPCIIYIFI